MTVAALAVTLALASTPARRRRRLHTTPATDGMRYEEVRLASADGTPLTAWWIPAEGARRAAIVVTGWSGNKSEPKMVHTAALYHRAGMGTLLLDLRCQGGSGGRFVTAGILESADVRAAIDWLGARGFSPGDLVLHGFSMGGATVVMAAPGTGVGAVVSDSAYADLPLLLSRLLRRARLPAGLAPYLLRAGGVFARVDARNIRPAEQAGLLYEEGVPLLIAHSQADGLIPFEHAGLFATAHPDSYLIRTTNPGHAAACDLPQYSGELLEFLRKSGLLSAAAKAAQYGNR